MWEILADFISSMISQFFRGKVPERAGNKGKKARERQPISHVIASDRTARANRSGPARLATTSTGTPNAWRPDAATTDDASWYPDAVITGDDAWHPDTETKKNDPYIQESKPCCEISSEVRTGKSIGR